MKIPDLGESSPILHAAQVWSGSGLSFKRSLELGQAVSCFVRRYYAGSVYSN